MSCFKDYLQSESFKYVLLLQKWTQRGVKKQLIFNSHFNQSITVPHLIASLIIKSAGLIGQIRYTYLPLDINPQCRVVTKIGQGTFNITPRDLAKLLSCELGEKKLGQSGSHFLLATTAHCPLEPPLATTGHRPPDQDVSWKSLVKLSPGLSGSHYPLASAPNWPKHVAPNAPPSAPPPVHHVPAF